MVENNNILSGAFAAVLLGTLLTIGPWLINYPQGLIGKLLLSALGIILIYLGVGR